MDHVLPDVLLAQDETDGLMTEQPYTILNFGVDSLWLNCCYADEELGPAPAELEALVLQRFTGLQELAREQEEPIPTDLVFNGKNLFIYPHGGGARSPWRFLLRSSDLELKIGTGKKTGYVAKVRLSASYLWTYQVAGEERTLLDAIEEVWAFLCGFVFNAPLYMQVAEVHLCADLCYDFSRADWQDGFVRRCALHPHFDREMHFVDATSEEALSSACLLGPDDVFLRHRPITGYSFGTHSSPLSSVIYNKSQYIRTKEKESNYFEAIWRANGWDGETDVWRVEFRLKRDVLREFKIEDVCHGIEDARELPDRLEVMWTYCSLHWIRYVIPDTANQNRGRWQSHPVWQVVQHAFFPRVRIDLAPIVRERRRVVNLRRMVEQITGCSTTYHAWLKADEPCYDEDLSITMHKLYQAGLDYMEEKQQEFNAVVRGKQLRYELIAA